MAEHARLTLDMSPELHRKLKVLAARRGMTMRDVCIRAIENEVSVEGARWLTAEEAPLLAELWDNDADAVFDDV